MLKGANSTLFGVSDPGGSVNFVTKTPKFARFGEVYGQVGSFEQAEIGFDFGDTLNADQTVAYRLTGKVRDSELEYDHSRDDEAFLMGGLAWSPTDDTRLSVMFDHLKRDGTPNSGGYPLDREYDRGDFFGEPDYNDHDVERSTLTDDFGYVYLYDFEGRTGDELSRYYFGTDSTAEELIGNVIVQYDTSFGSVDSSTLAGVEFRDASLAEQSYYGLASPIDISNQVYSGAPGSLFTYSQRDSEYETTSLFVQQNLSFSNRVIATVGVRHDWLDLSSKGQSWGVAFDDSDDFSETSMRGALTWKVTDEVSSYVSYAESVAPPAIGVEPERGEQYEIGVKYQPAGMKALLSASVFDLARDNVTVAVVQGDGTIERQVVGKSRVRGFEIEGKAEIAQNWDVIASYSYLDSEVVKGPENLDGDGNRIDTDGNQFANVPNHLASVWVNYMLPGNGARGDMTFGLGARHVGAYYYAQSNDSGQSKATTLLDAAFSYDITENTGLAINVSNLMDEQHVVGKATAAYYNPGRTVSATLRRTW